MLNKPYITHAQLKYSADELKMMTIPAVNHMQESRKWNYGFSDSSVRVTLVFFQHA